MDHTGTNRLVSFNYCLVQHQSTPIPAQLQYKNQQQQRHDHWSSQRDSAQLQHLEEYPLWATSCCRKNPVRSVTSLQPFCTVQSEMQA